MTLIGGIQLASGGGQELAQRATGKDGGVIDAEALIAKWEDWSEDCQEKPENEAEAIRTAERFRILWTEAGAFGKKHEGNAEAIGKASATIDRVVKKGCHEEYGGDIR